MNRNRRNHGRVARTGERLRLGRPTRLCKASAFGIGLAGLLWVTITIGTSARTPQPITDNPTHGPIHEPIHEPIHGTITRVDAPRLYFSLYDDDGRPVNLTSANVDAMRTLQAGDHVRVDLDGQGIALNINKTVPAPYPVSYSQG